MTLTAKTALVLNIQTHSRPARMATLAAPAVLAVLAALALASTTVAQWAQHRPLHHPLMP